MLRVVVFTSYDFTTFQRWWNCNFEEERSSISRSKRATDYSAEAYEDDEEEDAKEGSAASEATYEDEVSFYVFVCGQQQTDLVITWVLVLLLQFVSLLYFSQTISSRAKLYQIKVVQGNS